MTLVPFEESGQMSATAAAQQLAIVCALYWDDRAALLELLDITERVAFYAHRADTWPPSLCVIDGGNGNWFLVFAGTTNISPQIVNHVGGTMGQRVPNGSAWVNYQWAAVWAEIKEEIADVFPPAGAGIRVYLAGHSYGAAIAHLAGNEYAARYGPDRVQVLGIGEPRSYTSGLAGPAPAVHYRLRSWFDVVPNVPAPDYAAAIVGDRPPDVWPTPFLSWFHYGQDVWLAPGGQFEPQAPLPFPLPPKVSFGPVSEHLTPNYWGRLNAHYEREGGTPAMRRALDIGLAIIDQTPVQHLAPQLPRQLPAPDAQTFTVPYYDAAPQSAILRESTMASPVNPQYIFKLTFLFNMQGQGWEETFTLNVTGTDSATRYANLKAWANSYATIRRRVLSSQAEMVGVRFQSLAGFGEGATKKGRGQVLTQADVTSLGTGGITGASQQPNVCWSIQITDSSAEVIAARHYFRGLAEKDGELPTTGGRLVMPVPARWLTFKSDLQALIRGLNPAGQNVTIGASALILSGSRSGNTAAFNNVIAFGVDAGGYLTYQLEAPDLLMVKGTKVQLQVDRGKCSTGLSGVFKLTNVVLTGPNPYVYTTNKRPCCTPASLGQLSGKVRAFSANYFNATYCYMGRLSTKKTGKSFFVRPGRQSGQCC